jgi:hypothetical protein
MARICDAYCLNLQWGDAIEGGPEASLDGSFCRKD